MRVTSTDVVTHLGHRLTLLAVFLLAFGAVRSDASITVTKSNLSTAVVDGSSVDQAVSFSAADFAGQNSTVGKITVTVTFAKTSLGPTTRPGFNEVGFTISSATGSENLIVGNKGTGSFKKGDKGSFFVGTITFDMDAANLVNQDPDQIQAGTWRPDNGDLAGFAGGDAIGDWTLTITDAKDKGNGNTPLTVTSWSVSITTVPEPDSIGLWSMAGLLAALIAFHRPRRRIDRLAQV